MNGFHRNNSILEQAHYYELFINIKCLLFVNFYCDSYMIWETQQEMMVVMLSALWGSERLGRGEGKRPGEKKNWACDDCSLPFLPEVTAFPPNYTATQHEASKHSYTIHIKSHLVPCQLADEENGWAWDLLMFLFIIYKLIIDNSWQLSSRLKTIIL